jgi:hypothetical protein
MENQDEILTTTDLNDSNKSVDLKSLMDDEKMKEYMEKMKNFDMSKISELLGQPSNKTPIQEDDPVLRREELRKRLHAKTNTLKGNRASKNAREQNQINELKANPMFQNAGSNETDIKNMIDAYASKMTSDPKQKKNIKKQMDSLIQKMNDL